MYAWEFGWDLNQLRQGYQTAYEKRKQKCSTLSSNLVEFYIPLEMTYISRMKSRSTEERFYVV